MMAWNLRSLLVAVIVLSNCITWTASRHHIRHHHGSRTRHRRQGQGLFLSASYVIPGGEGTGWGEWGEDSPCSRTCGGGVASQKRICLQIGPNGESQCTGGDTKYFSCHTQDCPSELDDFRAEQCTEFDDKDFRGFKYEWIPYTKAPNPCELNCMPRGERFYYRHKAKVIDGTRCADDSFDVCVDGICQPVGCDRMLGSAAKEDKCRECRGNGSNCHTIEDIVDRQDLINGYNDILLIPAGSTTIVIEEIAPSTNYLALRSQDSTFYLNGYYHIDFPRTILIAGAFWNYERSQSGFPAPDRLTCQGPTNETLILAVLLQEKNVGIKYEYSVPKKAAPIRDTRYNWVTDEFTPCNATCGGGVQTRAVTCRSSEELEIVDTSLCHEGLKPADSQVCNNEDCPPEWVAGEWSECSKRCGSDGVAQREVNCQKIIANGYTTLVAERECLGLHGPKPDQFKECNRDANCPSWFIGVWGPCDKLCDEGKQKRQVVCHQRINGRVSVFDDEECEDEKPATEQSCVIEICDGVDWITTEWSGCDTCLSTVSTRVALCAGKDQKVFDDSFCGYHNKPDTEKPCDEKPPCEALWYASQWSKCSTDCGEGVQTRRVFCGVYDGTSVEEVPEEKCDADERWNDTKPCQVPKEECPSQWFAAPWNNCTQPCGGGTQLRHVMCLRGDTPTDDCDVSIVFDTTQICNTQLCDTDELIPVDGSTTVSDEEYCEDEEDYPEVGAEEDTSTTLSGSTLFTMQSDSPSTDIFGEPESFLSVSTDTGSGFGSTEEGSGSSLSTDFTTEETDTDETGSTGTGDTISTESSSITDSTTSYETGSTESSPADSTTSSDSSASTVTAPTTTAADKDRTDRPTAFTTVADKDKTDRPTAPTTAVDKDRTDRPTAPTTAGTDTTTNADTATGVTVSVASESTSEIGSTVTSVTETDSTETSLGSDGTSLGETGSTLSTETSVTDKVSGSETSIDTTKSLDTTLTTGLGVTSTPGATSSGSDSTSSTDGTSNETGSTVSSSDVDSTTSSDTDTTDISSKTDSTTSDNTVSTSDSTSDGTETTVSSSVTDGTTSSESSSEASLTTSDAKSSDVSSTTDIAFTTVAVKGKTDRSTERPTERPTISTEASSGSSTTSSGSESTTEAGATTSASEGSDGTTVSSSTSGSESTEAGSTASESSTTESASISTDSVTSGTGSESTTISGSDATTSASTGSELTTSSSDLTTPSSDATTSASTESSTSGSDSTTSGSEATTSGSESTVTEISSTSSEVTSSDATSTELSASTTELAASTTESGASTTESGASTTESGASTTESGASTTESGASTTESGAATTESGASTTELESSTTASTGETGSTTGSIIEVTTVSLGKTTWTFSSTVTRKKMCKRRKRKSCRTAKFGCCPDKKTPAIGPFDEGCEKPHTCKDTDYGCCPDGLSPAKGDDGEGCPTIPCEKTLYGCCLSDNTTALQGNDQDGCPPPPPACMSSKFGCCADEETEATGPNAAGCPESEEPTSTTEYSTTEATESSTETDTTESSTSSVSYSTDSTESSTTSEDSTTVTAGPGCADSEFGCCYDNETEASGPEGQGCPCNATEFGCCADGEKPAQTADKSDCGCSNTAYGCCSDGVSPAHGPDSEGCCLLTAFLCCPDNRTPAKGPSLEGCDCQTSLHGCCPDNKTIAAGPDNEGCGCQYTEHGCCQDRHTPAAGPDYEGCKCNTYQFGCCADGETVATGPGQQGCNCQQSLHGCCGDNVTPAGGPNGDGCDCSVSEHGCCADGETPAQGPNFLGCAVVPEDRQAACGLKTDAGPCSNFTTMWYFDTNYGGCSRFWYGGCEGNGNRFATTEECHDTCVKPAPKDACRLPVSRGACTDDLIHWYYNSTLQQCAQFRYGGCLGNDNNFLTLELCQQRCQPTKVSDICSQQIEEGPCSGNFSRWGFNAESGVCEEFTWGGCQGNDNRFKSEAACQMRCSPPGVLKPICLEPQAAGDCSSKEALWSFRQDENRCMPFYYTGCGGNNNKFQSKETCEQTCPSSYVPDKCILPAEAGGCSDYRVKWFYDANIKRCRQFYYGGCDGNGNNFESEVECESSCQERVVTTTTVRPAQPQPQPEPQAPEPLPETEPEPFCFFPIDEGGRCSAAPEETRFAYDHSLGKCITFHYRGCGGNSNNFPSEEYCTYYCKPAQDICQLPMQSGPCDQSLTRWFYDASTDACSQFAYGGCEGNENRFESREDCESRCRVGPQATTVAPSIDSRTFELIPPECRTSPSLEECTSSGEVWYLEPESHECVSHYNYGRGSGCRHTATFPSQEACERGCGAFRGVDVCKQILDAGPGQKFVEKVYFDQESRTCKHFPYGGFLGGANRFSSIQECLDVCKDLIDVCSLQPEQGECRDRFEQWYYDAARGNCERFIYTGCGGNDNRFETQQDCESRCRRPTTTTTPSPIAPPQVDCEPQRQECDALVCGFGVRRVPEGDCERCECENDPCSMVECPQPERCEVTLSIDPYTREQIYSATCINDEDNLVQPECALLAEQCRTLQCPQGLERTRDQNGCTRCKCRDLCEAMACGPGERCVEVTYKDYMMEQKYTAECRPVVKPGLCPTEDPSYPASCERVVSCSDDADCRGEGKCCQTPCGPACAAPEPPTPAPVTTTTYAPDLPGPPRPIPQPEPEVSGSEGDRVALKCLFHGNPPPKITWRRRELTIEGDVGRYRLLADGTLEIVSLYRNDSGVYICVAANNLGSATQEITLLVNDPKRTPVGIAGDENAVITGELYRPLLVRCLSYGYPPPDVYWEFGGSLVAFDNAIYENRGNTLLIRSLTIDTLGPYTCQAFNGEGKAASWVVSVRAYRPRGYDQHHAYLVPREDAPAPRPATRQTFPPTTTTTTTTTTERLKIYLVPVSTVLSPSYSAVAEGKELRLSCDVDGFPEPTVQWTKDGLTLQSNDRISISGSAVSRLVILRLEQSDSGLYGCHANNGYSSHTSTAQVNVQQNTVPAKCTDNPFFADCALIVRSNYCNHHYYSKFCCKSCVEAGQLDPRVAEMQADQPFRRRK